MDRPIVTPEPQPMLPQTIDDALRAAGTMIWEWDMRTDELRGGTDYLQWLGYCEDERLRTQAEWDALMHPDDRAGEAEASARHFRRETPLFEHEYRVRTRDGRWRWVSERGRIVEWNAAGEPQRMVGTLCDIERRRSAEAEALAMADRLAKIARHVPGIVFQFERRPDGTSRFPYVSDSCQALLGLPPEVLTRDATAFIRLVEADDRARVLESIAASARTLRPWRCSYRLHGRTGEERWLTGSATPQLEAGGVVLWHGYIEDTTDLHRLDDARRAAAAAEAASAAKTEFLSRVSHELRTPLNAVLGFAQLLELDRQEPLTRGQAKRVALIREAGDHLLRMIGELLDLTRIESGQLAVELGDVAVQPLLAESVELLSPQAAAAGLSVALDGIEPGLQVRADATRLRQVVLNLLSNAIKYNRRGGTVRLGARREAAEAVLHVADTGVGIAVTDLPRLFEPFDRLAHRRSPIEGAGIGLAVTRRLVELMRGRIDVTSEAGVGTTFRVALPLASTGGAPA